MRQSLDSTLKKQETKFHLGSVRIWFYSVIALCTSLDMVLAAEVHGVLRVVKGVVEIKKSGQNPPARARLGDKVFPKDIIVTGNDSRAKIIMVDSNEINVSPNSEVEIKDYHYNPQTNNKQVLLNVVYGKIRNKVQQKYDGESNKFEVATPTAVAGVRGTDFLVGFDAKTQATEAVCFEGAVQIASISGGPAVSITPGETTRVRTGAAPDAPVKVSSAQLGKMNADSAASSGSDEESGQGAPAQSDDPGAGGGGADSAEDAGEPQAAGDSAGESPGPKANSSAQAEDTAGSGAPVTADGGGARAPASEGGGCSMCLADDFAGGGREVNFASDDLAPPLPMFNAPPTLQDPGQMMNDIIRGCDICRDSIENGSTSLIIRVRN